MESLENIYRINKERLHSPRFHFENGNTKQFSTSTPTLKSRKNSAGKAHIAKACF